MTDRGPATPGTAARCPMCDRLLEIGGCPQIGDGTDESVIACWQIAISRLKAENASLLESLREAREIAEQHWKLCNPGERLVGDARALHVLGERLLAAEQRAEAAEKERDIEVGERNRQWDKRKAAEKRNAELQVALRAAAAALHEVLCVGLDEGQGLSSQEKRAARAWKQVSESEIAARAALHDEERSAPQAPPKFCCDIRAANGRGIHRQGCPGAQGEEK